MEDSREKTQITRALVTEGTLSDILSRHYGLRMLSYKEMSGYDDKNIWVEVQAEGSNKNIQQICCHGYVLKITNTLDSQNTEIVDAQHEVMSRLYKSGVITPQAVPSLTGHLHHTLDLPVQHFQVEVGCYTRHLVHLYDFIPGTPLVSVTLTEGLCYKVGVIAGRVDKTLEGLRQQSLLDHSWRWHLDQTPSLLTSLRHVHGDADREMLSDILKQFKSRVLNTIEHFSAGTIHTDFNQTNILVSRSDYPDVWGDVYDLAGLLDYGDCSNSPYVFEIAIAMTHMSILSDNTATIPTERSSGYTLSGYLSEKQLSEKEINLLKLCMCARASQVLVLSSDPTSSFRSKQDEQYFARLRQFWRLDDVTLVEEWRNLICQQQINNIS